MPLDEYQLANLRNWEARVPIHAASATYDLERYVRDRTHLSPVVRRDQRHLGRLGGRRVAHLQCHLGTDSLSLARLGAEVTGVDFSPGALEVARDLAARAGPAVRYVLAAVDEVPERLPERFDLVYTGVGALNWLPSIARWAEVVAGLLEPGGRLYVREVHPVLEALDDTRTDHELVIAHPYFETRRPQRWVEETTYTDGSSPVAEPTHYGWNHGLGEVVQAVLDAGLQLTRLEEHTELEWAFFDWMAPTDDGAFVLPEGRERLPLMYTLEAVRPATTSDAMLPDHLAPST